MSLHSHQFAAPGESLSDTVGSGDHGADSLYGSLSTLGPRKMKKKPVLVLDEQELAKAHMAIAMGGAEIMDTAATAPAPRTPQPAMLLGLAPMRQDDGDEDLALYPPHAFDEADEDVSDEIGALDDESEWPVDEDGEIDEAGEVDADDDEASEPGYATLSPFAIEAEDEDEEGDEVEAESHAFAPPARSLDHLLGGGLRASSAIDDEDDEDAVPSIADQLRALRERSLRQQQSSPAPMPAPDAVDEPIAAQAPEPPQEATRRATIERLEIDDWARITPVRAIVPPTPTAAEPVQPEPVVAELVQPEPVQPDHVLPEPVAFVEVQPAAAEPTPAAPAVDEAIDRNEADEWDEAEWDEAVWPDQPVDESAMQASPVSLLSVNQPRAAAAPQAAASRPHDHRAPPSALRARIREQQERAHEVASPSLLARLVQWLQALFTR